jgi:UDP-N-acetylmuramoyl-L-alanyl-D-glutamate--2,6-diaminopimelate ligase
MGTIEVSEAAIRNCEKPCDFDDRISMSLISILRRYIPKPIFIAYHLALAYAANVRYRSPSDSMIVIGITGTNGKSSTVNFAAQILTTLGYKVGYTSTAGFTIAGREIVNAMKMTMPGRFALQKLLREMVDAGCQYVIVETSSQGLVQNRHVGVNYDVGVFTNLTPEHIESHRGFENYKKAKGIFFAHLGGGKRKRMNGRIVPKVNVVNADDEHASFYAAFSADRHMTYGFTGDQNDDHLVAHVRYPSPAGVILSVNGVDITLPLLALFEHKNALAAIAAVVAAGIPLRDAVIAAAKLRSVPGRFETIDCGQLFTVIVDYAYEPYALLALYDSLPEHEGRVIGIHGSAGGGRDVARREKMGRLVAEHEDFVIVTNEDPYEEDPRVIIEAVAKGAREFGKVDGESLFTIDDRQEAIDFAIDHAKDGDIVLVTGKGSESVMAVKGGSVPWDDRTAVRSALAKHGYNV